MLVLSCAGSYIMVSNDSASRQKLHRRPLFVDIFYNIIDSRAGNEDPDKMHTFPAQPLFRQSGPSCSKLTMSLVNVSLKFTSSDMQIC